jgi:hypothetical protein
MKVQIKTKHYKESPGFLSNTECPLALALKDALPDSNIRVGGDYVKIDGKDFNIEKTWGYGKTSFEINRDIREAKEGKEIETMEIEINEIKSQETPPVEVELGYMIDVWIQHHGSLNLDTNEQEIIDFYNRITS